MRSFLIIWPIQIPVALWNIRSAKAVKLKKQGQTRKNWGEPVNARKRIELGAERAKYIWRIREFMSDSGKDSYSALARELGVTSETVRRTIMGTLHSKTVLDWLRQHGVPEKYICDPAQESRPGK